MMNVVYGVYRFLGFHICSYLLEKGHQVAGCDWQPEDEEADEKQLMLGRNVNFSRCDERWTTDDEVQLYICLYDYLDNPDASESKMQQLTEEISLLLAKLQKQITEIVVFIPNQMQDHFHCTLREWKIKMKQDYPVRLLYISELYGPWLPSSHTRMNVIKKEKTVLKANMSKYIFIDDFLRSWQDIMALTENEVFIAGKQDHHWNQDLTTYVIEAKTSLREGIQLIEEHNEKLEMLRKRF